MMAGMDVIDRIVKKMDVLVDGIGAIFDEEPAREPEQRYRVVSEDAGALVVAVDAPGAEEIEVAASLAAVRLSWRRGEKRSKLVLRLSTPILPDQVRARYADGVLTFSANKRVVDGWIRVPVER